MSILISRLILMTAVWRVADGKAPLPYSSNGECDNKTSEYYIRSLNKCCSKCKPGTRLKEQCKENSDTICAPCPDGQYSEGFNHFPNCFSCPSCKDEKGLTYEKKCSADTKTVCVCKPGMFCGQTNFFSECEKCRKYKSCKHGEHITIKGSPEADVKCESCPSGTFSNHINAESCQPHTQCGSVLRLGNSTADTQCDMTAVPSKTAELPLQAASRHPHPREELSSFRSPMEEVNATTRTSSNTSTAASLTTTSSNPETPTMIYCAVVVCGVLVLLTLTVMVITCKLRKRRAGLQKVPITDVNKLEQVSSESGMPDCQHLLHAEKCQKEPSMSSSDSQSQPDSSQSHSSGDWVERTSQEESLPEPPSVSSPVVNLSITATFNCQLNPGTASCSIPLSTSTLSPHVEAPVPLSQEEVCTSCQQEDGKEALRSVQESGPCAF